MSQLRSVYRLVWRESARCKDYTTRHFIRRKLRESFRGGAAASGMPAATLEAADEQLAEIRRIVDVTNAYHGAADGLTSSVMENLSESR